MHTSSATQRSARPTTIGPGSSSTPRTTGSATSDRTLQDWQERCTDQSAAWLVVRLISCKFHWLRPDGQWSKKQREAAVWTEREDAYQQAQKSTGLLYLYDRQ